MKLMFFLLEDCLILFAFWFIALLIIFIFFSLTLIFFSVFQGNVQYTLISSISHFGVLELGKIS